MTAKKHIKEVNKSLLNPVKTLTQVIDHKYSAMMLRAKNCCTRHLRYSKGVARGSLLGFQD